MASVWDTVYEWYTYINDDLTNSTTKGWFLISSPFPLIAILIIYNIFCTKIGPLWMKNRQPYKVETAMQIYNVFQVIISTYLLYEGCIYLFSGKYNFYCEGPDDMIVEKERIARAFQTYFMTKLIELLDTVFFVLRKSDRQITFLHLYHHTIMPIAAYIALKYLPGGQAAIVGTINSFVHMVMYTYYLISGMGPQYKKYLKWKQYVTILQIVQFLIGFTHSFNSIFYTCRFPTVIKILTSIQAISFIYMFSKFYYITYIVGKTDKNTNAGKNGTGSMQYESNTSRADTLHKNNEDYVNSNTNVDTVKKEAAYKHYVSGKASENGKSKTKNKHL